MSHTKSLQSAENEWLKGHILTGILFIYKFRTVRNYSCNGHFDIKCTVIWMVYYNWNNLNWHPHFKIIPANTKKGSVLFNHANNSKEHRVDDRRMKYKYLVLVKWYWWWKVKVLREKPVPVPLCSPHLQHGLAWGQTQVYKVRCFQSIKLYSTDGRWLKYEYTALVK